MPRAMRVTFRPRSFSSSAIMCAVTSPSAVKLVAMITSSTPWSWTRTKSLSRLMSRGPTLSSGEMRPISTKYRPSKHLACSSVSRSAGISTTHSKSCRRSSSAQIGHSGVSLKVLQRSQWVNWVSARSSARASLSAPFLSRCSRWKAMRCAVLGPTPGSTFSAEIRWSRAGGFFIAFTIGKNGGAGAHAARQRPSGK